MNREIFVIYAEFLNDEDCVALSCSSEARAREVAAAWDAEIKAENHAAYLKSELRGFYVVDIAIDESSVGDSIPERPNYRSRG